MQAPDISTVKSPGNYSDDIKRVIAKYFERNEKFSDAGLKELSASIKSMANLTSLNLNFGR